MARASGVSAISVPGMVGPVEHAPSTTGEATKNKERQQAANERIGDMEVRRSRDGATDVSQAVFQGKDPAKLGDIN